jgi:uncharacterized membrane protein
MTVWETARRTDWSTRAVIAAGLLAALLVAVVPLALLAGVVLMLLGHVIGGLALFGGSVLAAAAGVLLAGVSGARQLRRLVTRHAGRVVQLGRGEYDYQ